MVNCKKFKNIPAFVDAIIAKLQTPISLRFMDINLISFVDSKTLNEVVFQWSPCDFGDIDTLHITLGQSGLHTLVFSVSHNKDELGSTFTFDRQNIHEIPFTTCRVLGVSDK